MSHLRTTSWPSDRNHPVLAVSMGDMNGIGPEVILRSLKARPVTRAGIRIYGPATVLEYYAERMEMEPFWSVQDASPAGHGSPAESVVPDRSSFTAEPSPPAKSSSLPETPGSASASASPQPGEVLLVPSPPPEEPVSPGETTAEAGACSMQAVKAAVSACIAGEADAVVTAPISKEAIHKAGYRVPGHTEYLAELTRTTRAGMMLVNNEMRIGLATIHIPLRDVAGSITMEGIRQQLELFHNTLKTCFGIARPKIAVLGLNPHAGDGGVLGLEEQQIIAPAIARFRESGREVTGPWPADGFFASGGHRDADMVLAMYHDQGLIPLKLSGFASGVNVTAGLPLIRTSPDHGTAFSIAGKNRADAGSMSAALSLALQMVIRITASSDD
ncbi:4-hydroxythreonine-4-phosphate dehydrogenase PdxA [Balneolales bacterium ANBcel1]|nr:4-hydroxythreonine-4-phosphate dehydrogenase PdxA [Balneolales bacterium ANBcel1]